MTSRLAGKLVLVTGAGQGLGAGYARAAAAEGATVVVTDLDENLAAETAASCDGDAIGLGLDVTSEAGWDRVVEACRDRHGRLDALVNNAGAVHRAPLVSTSVADFQRVMDVNALGTFLGIRSVVPLMHGGGSIVNVSSTAGVTGLPGITGYTASKWAVRGLTRSAAVELAPAGIRVNCLVPGLVETPMTAGRTMRGHALRGGVGSVAELAALVVFLVSDESTYCTGADFVADGGETATTRPPVSTLPEERTE
jgi:3alpha(or 20beta)-hydroxysteroid dehydrogenase